MSEQATLLWCPHEGCDRHFTMQRGLTRHLRETHGAEAAPPGDLTTPGAARAVDPPGPVTVLDNPAIVELLAMLPAPGDYDYELVDDIGAALHRTLHAVYRAAP